MSFIIILSCLVLKISQPDRCHDGEHVLCNKIVLKYNNFFISVIRVPRLQPQKKCDPVSLYHYYTSLWSKFKPNVPGENDWAELRWQIRQKMAGSEPKKTIRKVVHFIIILKFINLTNICSNSVQYLCSNFRVNLIENIISGGLYIRLK